MQYIFIDESGVDKKEGRSSIALVYVSVTDIEVFNNAILEAERILKIESFHWSHSTWNVRKKFVEMILNHDFSVKIVLFKNPFYEQTAYKYIFGLLANQEDIHSIIIDGKKSRSYEGKIKKILRDKRIPVRNLRMANDEGYPALRVADACAGIARYYNEYPNDIRIVALYKQISKRITKVFEV